MEKTKITIKILLAVALASSGYYARVITEPIPKKGKIKIVEKTKIKIKYLKQPLTYTEYQKAYTSPIKINTDMINTEWMRINASDGWKSAETEVRLNYKVAQTSNWKFYVGVGVGAVIVGAGIYRLRK